VGGVRKALIIANDVYEHEGLKHLLAPVADAQALAGVLGDARIGGFDVQVVRNEPAHVIEGQIEDIFSDSRPDDVLLLHFSCHGVKSESGELYFAARNTRPNRLGSTAVSADFVQRCMRASRSRSIVLLLDCCYGGAFSQGVSVRAAGDVNVLDSFPGGKLGGGRGRAVITASSAMEYAFEGDQLADDHSQRPSVFTSALVEGLATGDADRDADGWVSLNELYDYVFDRVREQNPHQTPSRDVEMQGELYLARRSRPVTTPAPLPAELQQVIDHPLAGVRVGAVSELAGLQRGRHAGLALAARLALERLAHDDSRTVAAAAAATLGTTDMDGRSAPSAEPAPIGIRAPIEVEPASEPVHPPAALAGTSRRTPDSQPPPAPAGPPRRGRRRWMLVLGAAGVAIAVLVGVLVSTLSSGGNDSPPGGGSPGSNHFTAESPWRLIIRDNIGANDIGCDITVRNTGTGQQQELNDIYGTLAIQMRETGSFSWEASDPGCLVDQLPGPGKTVLPFAQDGGGDTDAFETRGKVAVEVKDFHGNSECKLELDDATDGRQLDFGTVPKGGGRLLLDPSGRDQVYLRNWYCGIRVSSA
jgi:hypothetical protein